MQHKSGYVYMLTNDYHTTLYIGVTSNLYRRVTDHKNDVGSAFTRKYACHKLVYYEEYQRITEAISREKVLKKWRRAWKERLINEINPEWKDLYEGLMPF